MKKNHTPHISVILPAYNAEEYLGEAIQSILDQTFGDFELIIINDKSTDATATIISSFNDPRILILNNTVNRNITYSLNKGIKEAKGKYIARMDADDIALPNRLSLQFEFLQNNPGTILVGSNIEVINEKGKHLAHREYPGSHDEIIKMLNDKSAFAHPTVMFLKSAVMAVQGYQNKYKAGQDYDLWLRLCSQGNLANLPEYLLKYRIHNDQITYRKLEVQHRSHMRARLENLGLNDYSLKEKLLGKDGTLGAKHLSIAYQQHQLGNQAHSMKCCFTAICHSPLNSKAWKFTTILLNKTKSFDLLRYYKKRIVRAIINK